MKQLQYKIIDEEIETYTVHHDGYYDDDGNYIEEYDEVVEKVIPIYGVVYEEVEEPIEVISDEDIPMTLEERLEELEKEVEELKESL